MRAIREGVRWFLRSGLRWAILALIIVAFLWFVPQLQGEYFSPKVLDKERPALVNEYRRTWAQIIGGFGLLLGLYFTWRRIEISQQELEATRDQQVTERFTRAIDQLGATDDKGEKKLEIRLGGIYALERIALDSFAMENSPGRDYSAVMEVLTAYVRENTTQAPEPSEGSSNEASPLHPLRRWLRSTVRADEGAKQPAPPEPSGPTADIQAILDVLIRTQARVPEELRRTRLDLREANLHGANFFDANLREAILDGANLHGANLDGARVTDEQLADTRSLQGCTMPDGRKYEEWLKDKEGGGNDGENQ
jgi:pentapeptide repeat protein